jgi:hypothetical protein
MDLSHRRTIFGQRNSRRKMGMSVFEYLPMKVGLGPFQSRQTSLQMKSWREFNINAWFSFMYSQK